MKSDTVNKLVLWITALILIGLEFYSLTTESHYKYDFIFLMLILLGVFIFSKKIKLHPLHYFLLAIFLILHNLGTFGTYKNFYFGMEFDFWVHSYFGIVSSLMLYRVYNLIGPYKKKWLMYIAIIMMVLGMSAAHELFEYAGAIVLGEGEGVLFMGAGDIDEWDTQKDMRNNVLGAIVGLVGYSLVEWFRKKK